MNKAEMTYKEECEALRVEVEELRAEVSRLRMYAPCARVGAIPGQKQINPTDLKYWGIE